MLQSPAARTRQRIVAALLAAGIVGVLLVLLATPMRLPRLSGTGTGLTTFDMRPDAPPPRPVARNLTGDPAPAAKAARSRPVTAPDGHVTLVDVPAAPIGGDGEARRIGAAVAGPGIAVGGVGDGKGADGNGVALGWTIALHARKIAGEITPHDYPARSRRRGSTGTVEARFTVGTDGRVDNCHVMGTSGDADLDVTTCRLIVERWRYESARDLAGRPIAEPRGWRQRWWFEASGVPAPPGLDR